MPQYFSNKKIWLIGGSRGMGLALAKKLISARAKLIISSRHPPKDIDKTTYQFSPLDVGHLAAVKKLCKKLPPLDGVIFMPALYEPGAVSTIDEKFLTNMIMVNIVAPTLITKYLASALEKRRGFLAICGSQAGNIGLPHGQPYSASKAYLKNFCESLYVEHPELTIHLIMPGFVKTDLTQKNNFAMPFLMTADKAGDIIFAGLKAKRPIILFPKKLAWLLAVWGALPIFLQKILWTKK
ncbi:MAG: SDR family NAD(P)-dependent oxidoreductase [Alphaproteobacteria bacterium]